MLETKLCKVLLENPLILASGIKGTMSASLLAKFASEAGAITTKSCCLEGRKGHPAPIIYLKKPLVLNAAGLPNSGVEKVMEEIAECRKISKMPIIASVFEYTPQRFGEVVKKMSHALPDFIELDMSCPNVQEEKRVMFSDSPENAGEVVKQARKNTHLPLIAKLSPSVADIAEIARACEKAGADAICATNTLSAMELDPYGRKFVLSNKTGGLSGPCLFPVSLRCVWQIRQEVKIPIIGTGGVESGLDAAKMLLAGADAVGVGSALYWDDNAFARIKKELSEYMKKMKFEKISDIRMV